MHILSLMLLALAFLFWFFSTIVLPEVREDVRYKLFALRDELRRIKIERPEAFSDRAFTILQGSINTTLALTPWISLTTLFQARHALKHNPALLDNANRRSKFLQYESGKTVARIYEEANQQFYRAFVANSVQLLTFLIPIWLVWELFYYLARKVPFRSWLAVWTTSIPVVPQGSLEEISPEIASLTIT